MASIWVRFHGAYLIVSRSRKSETVSTNRPIHPPAAHYQYRCRYAWPIPHDQEPTTDGPASKRRPFTLVYECSLIFQNLPLTATFRDPIPEFLWLASLPMSFRNQQESDLMCARQGDQKTSWHGRPKMGQRVLPDVQYLKLKSLPPYWPAARGCDGQVIMGWGERVRGEKDPEIESGVVGEKGPGVESGGRKGSGSRIWGEKSPGGRKGIGSRIRSRKEGRSRKCVSG